MKKRDRSLIMFLALSFTLLPFFGCATIIKGPNQNIPFSTDPEGAKVSVFDANGMRISEGTTPITLSLKRGNGYFKSAEYRVVFEAPGYQKKEVWISGSMEVWYVAGNLLVGGLIGWLVVDPLTGAMWHLTPDKVSPQLEKSLASGQGDGLHIVLADQIPSGLLSGTEPLSRKL
jgi:hypothetical protein